MIVNRAHKKIDPAFLAHLTEHELAIHACNVLDALFRMANDLSQCAPAATVREEGATRACSLCGQASGRSGEPIHTALCDVVRDLQRRVDRLEQQLIGNANE